MEDSEEYPSAVRVRGLGFMHQGWNTIFRKTDGVSGGKPVYTMDGYDLYGILPIIPVDLLFMGDKWRFRYASGFDRDFDLGRKDENPTELAGNWKGICT